MLFKSLSALLLSLILIGCSQNTQSNNTKYYQFDHNNNVISSHNADSKAVLLISNIKLSGSLNNRGIAMRVNKHQIQNANWHLWSASPEDMLLYSAQSNLVSSNTKWLVLNNSNNLKEMKNTQRYEVTWFLNKFNGGLDNDAEISGLWQLYQHHKDGSRTLLKQQHFAKKLALKNDGYTGLVASLESLWFQINQDFMLVLNKSS